MLQKTSVRIAPSDASAKRQLDSVQGSCGPVFAKEKKTRCMRPVQPLKTVVPGGGVALIRAKAAIPSRAPTRDQNHGIQIA